ncbi:MAG: hypothetical protein AB7K68_16020 [Bacteriovoracia bacterium]
MNSIFLFLLFLCAPAWAWPPTYGLEFTFTNPGIIRGSRGQSTTTYTPENEAGREALAEAMKKKCLLKGDCTVDWVVEKSGAGYRVNYSDGYWLQLSVDPAVVEVQGKPATKEEYKAMRSRLQDLFDAAADAGLKPHSREGGGHIHIGLETAFGKDAKFFRNFMVDMANHPELAMEILSDPNPNSPSLASHGKNSRERFAKIVKDFDEGKISDLRTFSERVRDDVYLRAPCQWSAKAKYQAVCLTRVTEPMNEAYRTVEIRAIRPQKDAAEFILELELIEGRLDFIRNAKTLIPYRLNRPIPKNRAEIVAAFRNYVTEMGMDWGEMRKLLPEHLQSWSGSCQKFFRSLFSKK